MRFASTAPAVSTGAVSRLPSLPRQPVFRQLPIRVMILDHLVAPRMISTLTARRSWGRPRSGSSLGASRDGRSFGDRLPRQLVVSHDAVAVSNLDLPIGGLIDLNGRARRRERALSR